MIDKKPTYEELLKWNANAESEYKAMEVFKSFAVCAGMMLIFGVISDFAKIGAATVFDAWKLSPESITSCNVFLQIGITFVYVYMAWHFFIAILFVYKEDINKFGEKWNAFKKWCKEHNNPPVPTTTETTTEVKE